jgi:hypothetical protein
VDLDKLYADLKADIDANDDTESPEIKAALDTVLAPATTNNEPNAVEVADEEELFESITVERVLDEEEQTKERLNRLKSLRERHNRKLKEVSSNAPKRIPKNDETVIEEEDDEDSGWRRRNRSK